MKTIPFYIFRKKTQIILDIIYCAQYNRTKDNRNRIRLKENELPLYTYLKEQKGFEGFIVIL